ncbi:MAG TPA: asparagine synthase (glutamine-hydrolyzing) [Firmicutes bacterium]|nr:asparagine synthase (glutamine-hydrolyzing) [Bacillota bacterium]
MCGIAGWVDWDLDFTKENRERKQIMARMAAVQAHRGPDAEGEWFTKHAYLVHRRLIVIDPAGGTQPMVKTVQGRSFTLVYNGELYNTQELRAILKAKGYSFRGHSDTEVLLTAYLEWGPAAVTHLNGIFAFAVWDEQRQELFLARDRLGVKPLFYRALNNGLLFASELKALLVHPLVQPEVKIDGLAELLLLGPGRSPGHGIFAGVHELKPGYALTYNREGLKIGPYWQLRPAPHRDDPETTVHKVRALLCDTVRRQLVSDVPICTLLSGGLDSSAITAIAAPELRETKGLVLHTYSVDFSGNDRFFRSNRFQPDLDAHWVGYVSRYLKTRHHYVTIEPAALIHGIDQALFARDLPGMADIDLSLLLFCREIKKSFTVAVSGEGADEIFGGYPWYYEEDPLAGESFPWLRNLETKLALLRPEIKAQLQPETYLRERFREAMAEAPLLPDEPPVDRKMRQLFYLNLTRWMPTLLDRKDRMSMYTGLEIRVPFCDHRLVEYVYNIPWALKNYHGKRKGILRAALQGLLPEDVRNRPKNPYPKTFHPDFFEASRQLILDLLGKPGAPLFHLVDPSALRQLAAHPEEMSKPWFGQLMRLPQLFIYLVQLNMWLEKYRVRLRV